MVIAEELKPYLKSREIRLFSLLIRQKQLTDF